MVKAYAYCRVSGLAQAGDDREGLGRQESSVRSFAQAHGYEIVQVYSERGVSGTSEAVDRPAFKEMMADILSNGCRIVICEALDRLARERRVQDLLLDFLIAKQVTLIAANTGENITEAIMGEPMRRFLVRLQG